VRLQDRVALMGLGTVLGGVQAMTLAAYDEAYAIPSEESALVSLHTQHILAYEAGVTKTVDPLAGSYYVEYLTDHFEREVEKVMADIEARGGMVKPRPSGPTIVIGSPARQPARAPTDTAGS